MKTPNLTATRYESGGRLGYVVTAERDGQAGSAWGVTLAQAEARAMACFESRLSACFEVGGHCWPVDQLDQTGPEFQQYSAVVSRPNRLWEFIDREGHEHRYGPDSTLPTLQERRVHEHYEGCECWTDDQKHYESVAHNCRQCGALVVPGTTTGMEFVEAATSAPYFSIKTHTTDPEVIGRYLRADGQLSAEAATLVRGVTTYRGPARLRDSTYVTHTREGTTYTLSFHFTPETVTA